MRQFVSFCPQRQKAPNRFPPPQAPFQQQQGRGDSTGDTTCPLLNSALPRRAFWRHRRAPFGAHAGPVTRGKTIHSAVALAASGDSFPRLPRVPFVSTRSTPLRPDTRPPSANHCAKRGFLFKGGVRVPRWVDCRQRL